MSEGLSKANHNKNTYSKSVSEGELTILLVMNRLDPIEELYDMYSEEEDAPRIVEIEDDGLDFLSEVDGPANPYMDL